MQNSVMAMDVMSRRPAASRFGCPIMLKMCLSICSWNKKGICIFPPQGYDKWGKLRQDRGIGIQEIGPSTGKKTLPF
ncbi:MAG TPA: hypothetical protein G4O06_00415 [Dehalococcoidia bacterium]|nr:hypothetical protein [Dehalococcoidia bacterium]